MRRSRTPAVLTACAAALLLGACSGDEEPAAQSPASTAAASSASPSTAAPPSGSAAPQAGSEFCTRSQALLDDLGAAFAGTTDPAAVRSAFEQAAEGFRGIEPPSAIEDDWTALADGLDEFATAFADLDENDPESVKAFQERTGPLQGELTASATTVESYLSSECGISDTAPSSAAGAAPSS